MAHQRVIIWFPNGDAEFYAGFDVPSVGDRITRNNSDWIVARVESHIDKSVRVTVMPSEVVRDDPGLCRTSSFRAESVQRKGRTRIDCLDHAVTG